MGKSDKGISIQERDIEAIKLVAKYRIVPIKKMNIVYEGVSYHYQRVGRLRKEGYFIKEGAYIKLGYRGKRIMDEMGIEYEDKLTNRELKARAKEIAEIGIREMIWDKFKPSWEIKKETNISMTNKIMGMVNGIAVFKAPKLKTKKLITEMINDIEEIGLHGYKQVIILYQNRETLEMITEEHIKMIEKQMMIPYNEIGLTLMEIITADREWKQKVMEEVLKTNYSPVTEKTYDAISEGKEIYVNIENCQKTYSYLKEITKDKERREKIEVICLTGQKGKYEDLGIRVRTIEWEEFYNTIITE